MKLGTENRKELIAAAVLGVLLLLVLAYEFTPSSSIASTVPATTATDPLALPANTARPAARRSSAPAKKERPAPTLDPTLQMKLLAATEAIKYEGSGRNIFVSAAEDVAIPKPRDRGDPRVAALRDQLLDALGVPRHGGAGPRYAIEEEASTW